MDDAAAELSLAIVNFGTDGLFGIVDRLGGFVDFFGGLTDVLTGGLTDFFIIWSVAARIELPSLSGRTAF